MRRRTVWATAAALAVLSSLGTAWASGILTPSQPFTPPIRINPPQQAPNFILYNQNGIQFNLNDNASGKALLIYFGYVHCPDICPKVMKNYADLEKALGPDASKVELLFVTTDPWRDTPGAIRAWLANFSSGIIGLTGTPSQLELVWAEYNVPPPHLTFQNGTAVTDPTATPGYLEDHFAFVFFADKGHVLRFALTPEMDFNEYVQGTRYLLSQP